MSESSVIVRQFQRADQADVTRLYSTGLCSYSIENSIPEVPLITKRFVDARCAPGGDMYDVEQSFIKCEDKRCNFFVAVDNVSGNIVGCVGAVPSTEFDPNEYMELVRMSVDTNYRGSGAGLKLLEAFEDWARSQGYRKLNLTTLDGMKPAVRFYSKNGFQPMHDKKMRLDLTKYGIVNSEKSNAVNVVHFAKILED